MILSIVMMVKNEEKNLNKTLSALKPLMESVESELIILDTGSTDKTLEICRKYTDNLYEKKWNGNFSEMRNESLKYAKGEWVLVLDADEELVKFDKLIDFLHSDKCNKYNSANIELLNLSTIEDHSKYIIGKIPRFFRNTEKLKYTGIVHEQPVFDLPIYNNIMTFKHYGYLFEDEELRQKKHKRNLELLKKSLISDVNNPYIYYQLGKQYITDNKVTDAYENMKKAYSMYLKDGDAPIYVYESLCQIYIAKGKNSECEKLCLKYIKKDNKNIDIYYYLGISQKNIAEYKKSIESYKRYLYLIDNYDITTQANNMLSTCVSKKVKDDVVVDMIKIYYTLNKFEEIIEYFDYIEDSKKYREVYLELFEALFNINRLDKIFEYYDKIKESAFESEQFRINLEKLIMKTKEEDKNLLLNTYSKFEGNYGRLNEIRLSENYEVLDIEILKEEKSTYYGDIIYYALKNNINNVDILLNLEMTCIEGYLNYIMSYRKDIIFNLYNYLIDYTNTLDINKLKLYQIISKYLLIKGNLINDKYKNILDIYLTSHYDYIKILYNHKLSDNELMNLINDGNSKLVLKIKKLEKIRNSNPIEYIKSLNKMLVEYSSHKKIIQSLIDDFKELNDETRATKALKVEIRNEIKSNVELGKLDIAKIMIDEYKKLFGFDAQILNISAVVNIMQNNLELAEINLKKSHMLDVFNEDTLFNIGYVKELKHDYNEAKLYYEYIMNISNDDEVKNISNEQLQKMCTIN